MNAFIFHAGWLQDSENNRRAIENERLHFDLSSVLKIVKINERPLKVNTFIFHDGRLKESENNPKDHSVKITQGPAPPLASRSLALAGGRRFAAQDSVLCTMTSCTAAHAAQLLSHSDRGFLLPGSKVTVRWLSGEIACETEYAAAEGSTDCETFLSAVLLVIAKSFNLPARYGCIVWNFSRQARGLTAAEGTINFTGPSEEDRYQSWDCRTCFICEVPCDDVDDIPGGDASQNCARCFPCCLCDECRIYLPKEAFGDYSRTQMALYEVDAAARHTWPVCFHCLGDGDDDRAFVEDVTLSRRQDFRLSVLNYDFHALLHSEPTPADLKHAD